MSDHLRYKGIQLPQLRGFCAAATEGNFTAAARALGVSPPTVWQQVRALERLLKTTLLRRRGRSVELTPDGRVLLELVQPHVGGLDSLERLFEARRSAMPQQLTAAAIPYLASVHLTAPIRAFAASHPAVRLKLLVQVWFDEVTATVERGGADIGLIFYDRDQPRRPHLDYERLFDLRFCLLTPRGHPLSRAGRVKPADIVKHPLIVPPAGAFARRDMEELLRRHEVADKANVVMETPLLDVIGRYVAAGLGVALVHLGPEAQAMPGVTVRPLDVGKDTISAGAVVRRGSHEAAALGDFRAVLRKHLVK